MELARIHFRRAVAEPLGDRCLVLAVGGVVVVP
jgi:hypothetical protein